MAIDKAVDSAVLDAGLTAIANAIREKAGTSDALAFPDAMVSAIEAMSGEFDIERGSYICADNSSRITVNHNLGKIPKIFVIGGNETDYNSLYLAISIITDEVKVYAISSTNEYGTQSTAWSTDNAYYSIVRDVSETTVTLNINVAADFLAGVEYYYALIA